jgi:hypothetical protein
VVCSSFIGLAGGTPNFKGGMTWMNEEGPEQVYLPKGSRVKPANRSKGGRESLDIHIIPHDDRFDAYVDRRSSATAKQTFAQGMPIALNEYGNTLFHDHFEKHAQNRRHRGGRQSMNKR